MNDCRDNEQAIAIVGMAGRFPGSASVHDLWQALQAGREAACPVSNEELRAAGIDEAAIASSDYVKSSMKLDGLDHFDANFFGYSRKQAESIDPQQRIFLECGWAALESAGYCAESFDGLIGVYAGSGSNTYQLANIRNAARQQSSKAPHDRPSFIDAEKDYLATRVSYKLGLTGPSIAVQTACSSSLVAVHLACQSLLSNECDMALAGGVSGVAEHLGPGYWYIKDGIYSPDGHCRAFDANASGTVFASGAGVVVLRRLKDALRDGNVIHAVITATAINNDGAAKAGYTAPSIQGQADVIAAAQSIAGVSPGDIGMIEAHGTGTVLGDAIELSALRQVFGARGEPAAPCAIGSLKTNIGHLDAAAGVAGLIKTALCLKHRTLVPSLHFEKPNPLLTEDNLFAVNTRCRPWLAAEGKPLRAGVSSFGIGGTNAHAILEEPPRGPPVAKSSRPQVVPLSAHTPSALTQIMRNLVTSLLERKPALDDVAYTLQVGRKRLAHRAVFVANSTEDLVEQFQQTLAGIERGNSSSLYPELRKVAQSWLDGDWIDWAPLHAGGTPSRIELPTYPFERERFWSATPVANTPVARAEQGARRAPDDWYYIRSWRASLVPAVPPLHVLRGETWLIFATPDPVCQQVIARLRAAGCPVAVVHPGESFAQTSEGTYSISPDSSAQYSALLDRVKRDSGPIRRVMHFWSLTHKEPELIVEALEALQPGACFSVLYLAQALAAMETRDATSVLVVTNELNDITGNELGHPGKAPLTALCNTLSQELPHIRCTLLELDEQPIPDCLIAETLLDGSDPVVAYRGRRRVVQCFEPVRITSQQPVVRDLHSEGAYVLIGGLGTVGLAVAERLVRQHQARVVLITRGHFPDHTEWKRLAGDPASDSVEARRIRRLLQIEAAGGRISVITADAADDSALEHAFEVAEAQFGRIRGVFHLAAETRHLSLNRPLRDLAPEHFQIQLRPKAAALCAIHRVLKNRAPDFVILFSSNASVLGGLGLTAYAAANACLDRGAALATAKSQGTTWIATNWDRWLEPDIHTGHVPADVPYAFSTEEGLDALWRILRVSTESQVVVSVSDFAGRLATWTGSRAPVATGPSDALPAVAGATKPGTTAPRSGFENQIADIWKDVLGASQIGIDESFLDLGGDSLIALRVTARIREIFEVDIPLAVFFGDRPTVAALAVEVVSQLARRADEPAFEQELTALAAPARTAGALAAAGVN